MATEHIVKGIKYGTYQKYKSLATKDPDFLYFITDKGGTIYKGSELVIPKNVIETVTRNAAGISTAEQDYYNFEIELFSNNSAGSTGSPSDPVKLTFSVYSREAVNAIRQVLEAAMFYHRKISGSGTEQDPYVYADGQATDSNFGHVKLDDSIDLDNEANNADASDGVAATPKAVYDAIQEAIGGIGGGIIFKGTIGAAADHPTVTSLPTNNYEAGWEYVVVTAGTYAGQVCEIGDRIMAINDGPSSGSTVINADWTVSQTNIDGAVTSENALDNNTLVVGNGNKTVKKLSNGNAGDYLRIINGVPTWIDHVNANHGIAHCTCDTVKTTAAKVAQLTDATQRPKYVLVPGAMVAVKFTYDVEPKSHNPAGDVTLNVQNTGAKAVKFRGAAVGDTLIKAGDTVTMIYDSTQWNVLAIDKDYKAIATSANYDDLVNKAILYLTDSTASATVARTIAAPDYTLDSNRILCISFAYGISVDGATLSVNSTTALPIYWKGAALVGNDILAGDTVTMINGGGHYNIISIDRKIDATPTSGSTNFVTSGGIYSAIQQAVNDAALWWEPLT